LSVFSQHSDLIDALWDRLDARLGSYGAPLDEQVDGLRRYIDAPARTYFTRPDAPPLLFLPLWLGARLGRDELLDVSESTALFYLYVRIQDDLLDEPETRGRADWLLLGNALLWDALELLRGRVVGSDFWAASREAWLLFSCATSAERTDLSSDDAGSYDETLFEDHCRKVAMAEIPLLAILQLQGRFELAPHVPPLIAELGVAYGLTNDVVGFRRDVAAGMRTHLIDRVRAHVPRAKWNDGDAMSRALLERDHIEAFLQRARRAHRRAAKHAKKLGISEFSQFTSERLARLEEIERQTQITRLSAALARETPEFSEEPSLSTPFN
jgi:hypothetical protein